MGKFAPEMWERLVSAERRAQLPPDAILDVTGVEPGSVVADIGAGPGYFTLPLAGRVGAGGRVHALDVQAEMIERLRGLDLPPQIDVRRSGESELPIEDPRALLAEVRRLLRPGGRLVVIEWTPREEEVRPPLHERIAADQAELGMRAGAFVVVARGRPNASTYDFIAHPTFSNPIRRSPMAAPTARYALSRSVALPFEEADRRVREELQKEGFGVLTEIDVAATLKKKLDVDIPKYLILGACAPQFAYQAIQAEPDVGLLLPCNVVVRDAGEAGRTLVEALDPVIQLEVAENDALRSVAGEVRSRMERALDRVAEGS